MPFSCLRLGPGLHWVSGVIWWLGGTQGTKTESLSPLSLGPFWRSWRPVGPGVDQASNTLNSNMIFHSHLVLISIAVMFTKDGVLFIKCNCIVYHLQYKFSVVPLESLR